MKKINIKLREIADFLKIAQLYGNINEKNDLHINGSVTVNGTEYNGHSKVKIYVNLCNENGEILFVDHSYKNYKLAENGYYSFSIYCADVSRFFDLKELAYAEVYVVFDETK